MVKAGCATVGLITVAIVAAALYQLPEIAAGGLLYPARQTSLPARPAGCHDSHLTVDSNELRGWRCPAEAGQARGTIVYLHGVADHRGSSTGVIARYRPRGFDVVAYDSRRHGESGGEVCTYGFHEKRDLTAILDSVEHRPVILMGTSLGAAIAMQAAADDPRVGMVIAAEIFSDLRTVALERAPALLPSWAVDRAFSIAETRGAFAVDAVSPRDAAARLTIPVLLIHGADDRDTLPAHSERVFEVLRGPKKLLLVPGAAHNGSLSRPETWDVIDEWIGTLNSEGT